MMVCFKGNLILTRVYLAVNVDNRDVGIVPEHSFTGISKEILDTFRHLTKKDQCIGVDCISKYMHAKELIHLYWP